MFGNHHAQNVLDDIVQDLIDRLWEKKGLHTEQSALLPVPLTPS
jgi:hypothetical protein